MSLELKNIRLDFSGLKWAVRDISFSVANGEVFVLAGGIGSGKSSILRAIAGLEQIASGDILLNNNSILNTPIKEKNIFLMQENLALFKAKTVFKNLAHSLKIKKLPKEAIETQVLEVAKKVQLELLLNKKIKHLSPLEKIKVNLARLSFRQIDLILIDDPFIFLNEQDAKTALDLIKNLASEYNCPLVYTCLDPNHAVHLNSKTAIIKEGKILQLDTIQNIIKAPTNNFVKAYINSQTALGNPSGEICTADRAV